MRGLKSRAVAFGGALMMVAGATASFAADMPSKRKELPVEAVPASVPYDIIFGARFQSDYNLRGVSQSDRKFSPQGYVELQLFDNLIYAGISGYGVDLPTRPSAELDISGGIRPKVGPFTFDFGFIQYVYPNERRLFDPFGNFLTVRDTDYLEIVGKVSYTYQEALTLGANVFYSYDYLGSGADGTYFSAVAKYTLPDSVFPAGFAVSGELGRYEFSRTSPQLGSIQLPDYTYWNAGVSYTFKQATLDLRYHDTDLNKNKCFALTTDPQGLSRGSLQSNWCSSAFIATLSFDFTLSQLIAGDPTPEPTAPSRQSAAGGERGAQ